MFALLRCNHPSAAQATACTAPAPCSRCCAWRIDLRSGQQERLCFSGRTLEPRGRGLRARKESL